MVYIAGMTENAPPGDTARTAEKPDGKSEKPAAAPQAGDAPRPREVGGPKGPEPTRYGDWEIGGRCIDF